MAWVERRVGPAVGTGSAVTVYTAPSGTALGAFRSARLTQINFSNTAANPAAIGLTIGSAATGTSIVALPAQLIPPASDKTYFVDFALEAGDIIQISCGSTVAATLTVEEYVVGTGSKKIFTDLIQASGSDQAIYGAPSGTTIGSVRGARVVCVHFCNQDTSLVKTINLRRGVTAGGLYIIAPGTPLLPRETKTIFIPISLEPGILLQQIAEAGVVTTVTAEEFIVGSL